MSERDGNDLTAGEAPAMPRTDSMTVGVIVEKRPSTSKWIDEVWMPVSVVPGAPVDEEWRVMREADGVTTYLARTMTLSLHRAEAEAYKVNLNEPAPHIYVVMTVAEDGPMPYEVVLVSCAPYEAEGYLVGDGEIVEPVPMPPEIMAWVQAFADSHYKPEPFIKRKRDKAPALEEHRFGKEPIFAPSGKRPMPDADGGGEA